VEFQLLATSLDQTTREDTTGFSRVEFQLLARQDEKDSKDLEVTPRTGNSEKLRLHAAEAGGISDVF